MQLNRLHWRKVFSSLCIIALVLSIMSIRINHVSAQEASVRVSPATKFGEPGDTVSISIAVSNVLAEKNVSAWQFSLSYNPTILFNNGTVPAMIRQGNFLTKNGDPVSELTVSKEPNSITATQFITAVNKSVSGSGTLATIDFKVIGKGNTTLHLYNNILWYQWTSPFRVTNSTTQDGVFYTWSPKADFSYSYRDETFRSPVVGENITFDATYDAVTRTGSYDPNPGGGIANYTWDFGDGSAPIVTTTPIVNYSYTASRDYTVALTVIDNGYNLGVPNNPKDDTTTKQLHVAAYDLALTDIEVYPAVATIGSIVSVNVTITNHGTESGYFNVSLCYDNTLIWFNRTEGKSAYCLPLEWDPSSPGQHMTALLPDKSLKIQYKWNTTGVLETPIDSPYVIRANVTLIASSAQYQHFLEGVESNLINNRKDGPEIFITSSPKNIAVKSITISPTNIVVGEGPISVNVIIENQGIFHETFNITVYYNITTTNSLVLFYSQPNIEINNQSIVTLELSWNTMGLARGTYLIVANVSYVPDEMVLSDNLRTSYPIVAVITEPPIAFFDYSPTTPKVDQTVTIDASGSYDPDGIIEFYTWDFGDGSSSIKSDPTESHIFRSAKSYVVTLTVTDNATITRTYTKTIAVDKRNSEITISASATTITFGAGIKITGTVSPAPFRANVTIQSKLPEEATWNNITTTMANATRHYSYTWTPPAAKTYQLRALWLGDADTYGNESSIISVVVNKMVSTLSIETSAESLKAGSSITISGDVAPAKAGATVAIYYRLVAAPSWQSISATTDSTGHYSIEWSSEEPGSYEIKARWEGDSNTREAESVVKTVTVEALQTGLFGIPLYVVGGIALAIVAVAVAVYFLRIRKR